MCRLTIQKPNKANSSKLYHPAKGCFREIYKLQNINPISPSPKFTLGIIQIIVKSMSAILVLSLIKYKITVQFQNMTFRPDPEVRVVCKVIIWLLCWSILLSL